MSDGKDGEKAPFGLLAVGIGLMTLSVYLLMEGVSYLFRYEMPRIMRYWNWTYLFELTYNLIRYIFLPIILFILGKEILCRKYWAKQVIIFISIGSVVLGSTNLLDFGGHVSHRFFLKTIVPIILGISCLYFLTRSGIKKQFHAEEGIKFEKGVEIIIKILLGVMAVLIGLCVIIAFLLLSALERGTSGHEPGPGFYLLLLIGVGFVIAGVKILFLRTRFRRR